MVFVVAVVALWGYSVVVYHVPAAVVDPFLVVFVVAVFPRVLALAAYHVPGAPLIPVVLFVAAVRYVFDALVAPYVADDFLYFVAAVYPHVLVVAAALSYFFAVAAVPVIVGVVVVAVFLLHPHHRHGGYHQSK